MEVRDFINKIKPGLVDNWSHQASLLSYGQVAELMQKFAIFEIKSIKKEFVHNPQNLFINKINRFLGRKYEINSKSVRRIVLDYFTINDWDMKNQ